MTTAAKWRIVLVNATVVVSCLLGAAGANAQTTVYVRANATGARNGTNWADALTNLPTTMVRGAIYYVADGTYVGAHHFNTPTAGAAYIYIRKATRADHGTDHGWLDSYGDGTADFVGAWTVSTGYWDFDGVTGGGPGLSPSQWPASWREGHGFTHTVPQNGNNVDLNAPGTKTNLRFRHIKFVNQTPTNYTGTRSANVFLAENNASRTHDVLVEYIYVPPSMTVPFHVKHSNDWTVQYSYFEGNGVGNNANFHRELWSGIDNDRWIWRWNYINNINNTAVWAFVNNGDAARDTDIYGNIIDNDGFGVSGQSAGRLIDADPGLVTNWRFFNNTVTGWDDGCPCIVTWAGSTINASNNLLANHPRHGYGVGWSATGGHNSFYNIIRSGTGDVTASWAAASGSNAEILSSDPFANYSARDLRLRSPIRPGTSANSPPGNAVDMFGNVRGADGVWDRGALEYVDGVSQLPGIPSNLRLVP